MPAIRESQYVTETLILPDGAARVTQSAVEVLMTYTAPSPTTVTGAGVSQFVSEVLVLPDDNHARVSQLVVELVFSAATTGEGGAPGGGSSTTSHGFVA
jgi:hypothetical protein